MGCANYRPAECDGMGCEICNSYVRETEQDSSPLDDMVICDHFEKAVCPKYCEHAKKHIPVLEEYEGVKCNCNETESTCGFRADGTKCKCI